MDLSAKEQMRRKLFNQEVGIFSPPDLILIGKDSREKEQQNWKLTKEK